MKLSPGARALTEAALLEARRHAEASRQLFASAAAIEGDPAEVVHTLMAEAFADANRAACLVKLLERVLAAADASLTRAPVAPTPRADHNLDG